MAITAADIKLLESERMTDTTDGGGRRTGNVIPDGVPGNIFPKVSRLDGVYGRVNIRKVFGAVQTPDLDTYAGAHAVIMDAPDNDRIHVNLFSTGSDFDDRTAARDRIESYVIAGPESRMTLYGRQLVGQQAIAVYQHPDEALPEVGEVYCLSTEVAGVVQQQQYVRITDVAHDVRTFEDERGTYQRRVINMKVGAPLRYEFTGPESPGRFSNVVRPALVRRTSVADAARYYGIQPLATAGAANALTVKVASVFSPIVPTTTRETPLAGAEIAGASGVEKAGTAAVPFFRVGPLLPAGGSNQAHTIRAQLPTAVARGGLRVRVAADAAGQFLGAIVTDDGQGNINAEAQPLFNAGARVTGGTVDYESGAIEVSLVYGHGIYTGRVWISHTVGAAVGQVAHTRGLEVTLSTRGTVYVETLAPLPAPGSLIVDYRALGKWYRLRDNGAGELASDDAAYGTGTINYHDGNAVFTLGALPDVGSSVLYSWASPAHYAIKAGATADAGATARQRIMLPDLPVKPSSVAIAYPSGAGQYAAAETAPGVISGNGVTGSINHATGELLLHYAARLPNAAALVTVNYEQEQATGAAPTSLIGDVTVTDPTSIQLDTQGAAIAPKGLRMQIPCELIAYGARTGTVDCADDGAGKLVTLDQKPLFGGTSLIIASGQVIGTVDYATGLVSITTTGIAASYAWWSTVGAGWQTAYVSAGE